MPEPARSREPHSIVRGVGASWPVARLLGVYVSVHWSVLFLPAAIIAFLPALDSPGSVVFWTTLWTLLGLVALWSHEMAHAWTARRHGIGVRHVVVALGSPLAHAAPDPAAPREQVAVALAGPAVHVAWALAAWALLTLGLRGSGHVAEPMVHAFLLLNLALLLLNLLPFHPLDGGRVLRGLLTARFGVGRAALWTGYVGYGGAVALGVVGLTLLLRDDAALTPWAVLLITAAVGNLMASQRLVFATQWAVRARTRDAAPPLDSVKPPDFLDERVLAAAARPAGAAEERESDDEPAPQPAPLARIAAGPVRPPDPEELQRRIDALLDRINEVGGLENLSAEERRELDQASELLRRP